MVARAPGRTSPADQARAVAGRRVRRALRRGALVVCLGGLLLLREHAAATSPPHDDAPRACSRRPSGSSPRTRSPSCSTASRSTSATSTSRRALRDAPAHAKRQSGVARDRVRGRAVAAGMRGPTLPISFYRQYATPALTEVAARARRDALPARARCTGCARARSSHSSSASRRRAKRQCVAALAADLDGLSVVRCGAPRARRARAMRERSSTSTRRAGSGDSSATAGSASGSTCSAAVRRDRLARASRLPARGRKKPLTRPSSGSRSRTRSRSRARSSTHRDRARWVSVSHGVERLLEYARHPRRGGRRRARRARTARGRARARGRHHMRSRGFAARVRRVDASRYREGWPVVLRGVSPRVAPGAKCGVVGRTGSGKSTLLAALFRLADVCAGAVRLGGVDLGRLALADARAPRLGPRAVDPPLPRERASTTSRAVRRVRRRACAPIFDDAQLGGSRGIRAARG